MRKRNQRVALSLSEIRKEMGRRHAYQRFHGYLSRLTFNRNASSSRQKQNAVFQQYILFFSSAGTLIISFIGLQTQEVDIKPVVNVVLKSDSEVLDEVMVVAYGTAKKSSFTGSATNIHADQITSGSRESIDKALSGKVTGVRIASATGDPGSMGEMNIRGVGSINGSTTPLYVIDGVIMKSDNDMSYYGKSQSVLSTLNPDDGEVRK